MPRAAAPASLTSEDILAEVRRQGTRPASTVDELVRRELDKVRSKDEAIPDILDYVRSDHGVAEYPRPAQRFILKLVFGLPLDDRTDDQILAVVGPRTVRVRVARQFLHDSVYDLGEPGGPRLRVRGESVSHLDGTVTFAEDVPGLDGMVGVGITARIPIWDELRTRILADHDEEGFLRFLNASTDTEWPRCNLTPERHNARLGRVFTTVVLRCGRRSGKTSISQWIASYLAYKLLRMKSPQIHYNLRREQPISMTLVSNAKDQAIELLQPCREALKRNLYLRQFVEEDTAQKLTLATPYSRENGLGSGSGIKIGASACSARSLRGKGNLVVLLEEYGTFYTSLAGTNNSDREIWKSLEPSTADFVDPATGAPEGMMLVISTPLSKEAHLYEIERQIRADERTGLVLHLPSYWVNFIPTEKLRDAQSDRIMFEVEWKAEYSDLVSSALTRADVERCRADAHAHPRNPAASETCYLGLDVGMKTDGTAISVVAASPNGTARLVHHEVIRVGLESGPYADYLDDTGEALDIVKLAARVDHLWEYYSVAAGMADAREAYGLKSHLRSGARRGLEFVEVNQAINDRIARCFLAAFAQRSFEFYAPADCWKDPQHLCCELVRIQKIQSQGTPPRIKLAAPNVPDAHDDGYSSLSRALWLVEESRGGRASNADVSTRTEHFRRLNASVRARLDAARMRRAIVARPVGSPTLSGLRRLVGGRPPGTPGVPGQPSPGGWRRP